MSPSGWAMQTTGALPLEQNNAGEQNDAGSKRASKQTGLSIQLLSRRAKS
jgi:hypothetical protein